MLLAGPSQSSSYSYASPRLSNISSSRTSLSSKSTSNESIPISSASSRYSLMKSFAVHLNRGTELLKQTVQRAILSKAATPNTELRTVAPTKHHKVPDLHRASTDSLEAELCYFRPIRPCPITLQTNWLFRKLPKIPTAIKHPPRKEKTLPTLQGKKQFKPSKVASAFRAFAPFKTPTGSGTKASSRKRKAAEEESVPPKVARVTRSTARKVVEVTRKTRANGKLATVQETEEQERRDFELAKKLQTELNRNSTASATSGYSLRSKRKSTERNTDPPLRRTTRRAGKAL
ncbi:uncharacterized protein LOC132264518 [Phlebotomus argentipes]|uniref:uncharacterized protein LOC132264518 n=1 Tax=Phlebotomus argentipes TaxID=94469 RepID=UPI0028935434|nr:uncharacterized protein LOC132264518 [Phlebotomus argentipes]